MNTVEYAKKLAVILLGNFLYALAVAFFILPLRVMSASVHTRVVGRRRTTPLKVTRILTGHVPSFLLPERVMTGL